MMTSNAIVRRADALTARERDELTEVLVACVDGGASLGFHAPLSPQTARDWWERFPREGVLLLIAELDGRIVGTAQLHPSESANGAHRGEISKLLVHPGWRRRGLARALMTQLEVEARNAGKTLLFLDTREGDPSNDLYARLGYREGGHIPDWARDGSGILSATVFWYKQLS